MVYDVQREHERSHLRFTSDDNQLHWKQVLNSIDAVEPRFNSLADGTYKVLPSFRSFHRRHRRSHPFRMAWILLSDISHGISDRRNGNISTVFAKRDFHGINGIDADATTGIHSDGMSHSHRTKEDTLSLNIIATAESTDSADRALSAIAAVTQALSDVGMWVASLRQSSARPDDLHYDSVQLVPIDESIPSSGRQQGTNTHVATAQYRVNCLHPRRLGDCLHALDGFFTIGGSPIRMVMIRNATCQRHTLMRLPLLWQGMPVNLVATLSPRSAGIVTFRDNHAIDIPDWHLAFTLIEQRMLDYLLDSIRETVGVSNIRFSVNNRWLPALNRRTLDTMKHGYHIIAERQNKRMRMKPQSPLNSPCRFVEVPQRLLPPTDSRERRILVSVA